MKSMHAAARFARIGASILVLLAAAAPLPAERLYVDTFVGSNGTRPGAWKPDEKAPDEAWKLANSELSSGNAGTEPTYALIASPEALDWTDYFVQTDFWNPDALGGAILVARYQNAQNFYEGGVFSEAGKRYMKIDRVREGQRETLIRQDETPEFKIPPIENMGGSSSRIVLRMVAAGNEIGLFMNGAGLIRTQDDAFSKGAAGLGAVGAAIHFDNVIVDNNYRSVFVPSVVNRAVAQAPTGPPAAGTAPAAVAAPAASAPPSNAPPLSAAIPIENLSGALSNLNVGDTGGGRFRVVAGSNLSNAAGNGLQRTLQSDGYSPVEVVEASGQFSVLVGNFPDRSQAEAAMADMRNAKGYSPEGIQSSGQEPTTQRVVSTAEAGKVFRVLVSEMANSQDADRARDSLVEDNYIGAEILQSGSSFQVVLGTFANGEEAGRLESQLKSDGYTGARVIEGTEVAVAPSADSIAFAASDAIRNLTPDQRREAEQIMILARKVVAGQASADDIIRLRQVLAASSPEVRTAVANFHGSQQDRRVTAQRLAEIYGEYGSLLVAGKWDEAERKLEEARTIAPDDPQLRQKVQQLARMRAGPGATAQTGSPGPGPSGTQATAPLTGVAAMVDNARKAEQAGELTVAVNLWEQIRSQDPSNTEAAGKITQLQEQVAQRAGGASGGGTSNLLQYALYGLGLVIVILGYFVWQNRRREARLEKTVAELASTSQKMAAVKPAAAPGPAAASPSPAASKPGAGESALASGSALFGADAFAIPQYGDEANEDQSPEPAATATSPAASAPITEGRQEPHEIAGAAGDPDVLVLGDEFVMPPTSEPEATVTGSSETLRLDGLDFDLNLPPTPESSPGAMETLNIDIPEIPSAPSTSSELTVDDLVPAGMFGGENAPDLQLPPMDTPPSGLSLTDDLEALIPPLPELEPAVTDDSTVGDEQPVAPGISETVQMMAAVTVPEPPAAETKTAATVQAESNGYYYRQDFDDETAGKMPKNWLGEYEYATLTVDTDAAVTGSTGCLKFEKKAGAGSANYVCTFPKAGGRVIVEFDVRCDEKNKYLLGFYIEKDEDFKQSVHTIVHRLDAKSQPSLRLHGEPVPYDFGTWRHVKYDLNLLAGVVSAYIDGQQVVTDARLAIPPAYVNTLSIRDNSATTGTLFLDNIMVYRG